MVAASSQPGAMTSAPWISWAQRQLPNRGGVRAWRVEARGFCVEPANAVTGAGRVVVSRFDFAGEVRFSGRNQAGAR